MQDNFVSRARHHKPQPAGDRPPVNRPNDPAGYFRAEVGFQLEVAGNKITPELTAQINGLFIDGLSPVAAVAYLLQIPRDTEDTEDESAA